MRDALGFAHQVQRVRADQDTRDEITEHGTQPPASRQRHGQYRCKQQDDGVLEENGGFQESASGTKRRKSSPRRRGQRGGDYATRGGHFRWPKAAARPSFATISVGETARRHAAPPPVSEDRHVACSRVAYVAIVRRAGHSRASAAVVGTSSRFFATGQPATLGVKCLAHSGNARRDLYPADAGQHRQRLDAAVLADCCARDQPIGDVVGETPRATVAALSATSRAIFESLSFPRRREPILNFVKEIENDQSQKRFPPSRE